MSNYRLLLVSEDDTDSRTGFVFCAGEVHARASAQALLDAYPKALKVEVNDHSGSVCRVERPALAKAS